MIEDCDAWLAIGALVSRKADAAMTAQRSDVSPAIWNATTPRSPNATMEAIAGKLRIRPQASHMIGREDERARGKDSPVMDGRLWHD